MEIANGQALTDSTTGYSSCLAGEIACNASAPCDPMTAHPRSCLTTRVPAWSATTASVHCCLRCCVLHWVRRLGLAANARHWRRMRRSFDVSSGTGGIEAAQQHEQEHGYSSSAAVEAPPMDSILFHRFALAQFAHVQAISLADWSALVRDEADVSSPRFSTPSARTAPAALVCLNGFGHILGSRRAAVLNVSHRHAAGNGSIMHSTAPPTGERVVFVDPIRKIFARALLPAPHGAHAVHYGDDKSLGGSLLETYRTDVQGTTGATLARYLAPNLSPEAARLPYATTVPLGLNRNARSLEVTLRTGGPLDPRRGAVGKRQADMHRRRSALLCCCMRPYDHRIAVARQLARNGFDCAAFLNGSETTRPFDETLREYASRRFVLDLRGRGNQDFRLWEILLAGAVPVLEYFEEQDDLLAGLPVVRVTNWSALTPRRLHDEWTRIRHGVASGELSLTKLYLPYWLNTFTAHMQPQLAR